MSRILTHWEIIPRRPDSLAEQTGFEPRLTESESAVLPLNYPPTIQSFRQKTSPLSQMRESQR